MFIFTKKISKEEALNTESSVFQDVDYFFLIYLSDKDRYISKRDRSMIEISMERLDRIALIINKNEALELEANPYVSSLLNSFEYYSEDKPFVGAILLKMTDKKTLLKGVSSAIEFSNDSDGKIIGAIARSITDVERKIDMAKALSDIISWRSLKSVFDFLFKIAGS